MNVSVCLSIWKHVNACACPTWSQIAIPLGVEWQSHLGSNGNPRPTWGQLAIPLGVEWQSPIPIGVNGNPSWGRMAIPLGVEWHSRLGWNGNPTWGQLVIPAWGKNSKFDPVTATNPSRSSLGGTTGVAHRECHWQMYSCRSHLGSNGNPTWGQMAIPLGVKL